MTEGNTNRWARGLSLTNDGGELKLLRYARIIKDDVKAIVAGPIARLNPVRAHIIEPSTGKPSWHIAPTSNEAPHTVLVPPSWRDRGINGLLMLPEGWSLKVRPMGKSRLLQPIPIPPASIN